MLVQLIVVAVVVVDHQVVAPPEVELVVLE
jgi:hypothetical protein